MTVVGRKAQAAKEGSMTEHISHPSDLSLPRILRRASAATDEYCTWWDWAYVSSRQPAHEERHAHVLPQRAKSDGSGMRFASAIPQRSADLTVPLP